MVAFTEAIADNLQQFIGLDGLVQVFGSARIHRLKIRVYLAVGGENYDRCFIPIGPNGLQKVQAITVRHPQIANDQIKTAGTQKFGCFARVRSRRNDKLLP